MLEAMCHFNLDAFTHYFSEGEVMGPFSRPSVSQSYVLECQDGKWIALHMSSPEKFWQGLADAIGAALSLDAWVVLRRQYNLSFARAVAAWRLTLGALLAHPVLQVAAE